VHWVRKEVANVVDYSIGLRGIEHGEFERERLRVSSVVDRENGDVVHAGAQVGKEASSGRPRHLATLAGRQAACLHTRTQRCARGGRAGQGPVILIGSLL